MKPKLLNVCTTDPFLNLAREEWLLLHAEEGAVALCLWQNERTVVIGRNQDAFAECDLAALEREGGHLARRLSGGGAVYHDLGNLNFTFLTRGAQDVPRHLEMIRRALAPFGIRAEISGRNDLTAEGAKFSGNAYYRSGDCAYHHGTLLVRTDLDALQRCLTPDRQKLAAKGVASVRSRVTDLTSLCPSLTVPALREALGEAFGAEYGRPPEPLPAVPDAELGVLREKYAGDAWRFRPTGPDAYHSPVLRLPMGLCRLRLWTRDGRVSEARLETDALETAWSEKAAEALDGLPFAPADVRAALEAAGLFALLPLLSGFGEGDGGRE